MLLLDSLWLKMYEMSISSRKVNFSGILSKISLVFEVLKFPMVLIAHKERQITQMKIETFSFCSYEIPQTNGRVRSGILVHLVDEEKKSGWGDIAPLPDWSSETIGDSLQELQKIRDIVIKINWTVSSYFEELKELHLLPSVLFGLESALISLLCPTPAHEVQTSALLMGSFEEILLQAKCREKEGYAFAKLKVSNLSFEEAKALIYALKDRFRLRIDVNSAWDTKDSLQFFAQFPLDTFDYVEEPFQNPYDLFQFPHPLAVDESFPYFSLEDLERLPTLKALIYKPTIQGGMLHCLSLQQWALKRGIDLVLSSSFESDIGLAHIAAMARRLSLSAPIGIGTYHYLKKHLCSPPLQFSHSFVSIPAQSLIRPKF
jgi:o-succinylbenzoate synthase